ncbi:uncharacterized protein PFL1_01883 [Pseudozyma flocculosa PF-1]|uniref:F-box domain-containing protein n=1 Tax=Pseudozyma flocculosa TaxID=84751 RepID=A0A5C3F139_9BASI|nr:uncharacterized protein PFL1_01883 [Pseudozyma flocculosa PF-1]EPQ30357.1 hypothetical protein PFL1_01883 [Pseudozyma flocculosa PF-1]SPO37427.1 uncharacterized protein PSFLO_02900 [Pseudozyma flocculosa]
MVDPVQCLPYETALHLLSFLDPYTLTQASCVSRSWSGLVQDSQLWRRVALRLGYHQGPSHPRLTVAAGTLREIPESPEEGTLDASTELERAIDTHRSRSVTRAFDNCRNFRQFCCLLWKLECNWAGKKAAVGPGDQGEQGRLAADSEVPRLRPKTARRFPDSPNGASPDVWRFKLDPIEKTIICTGCEGGVTVYDAHTFEILWHLAPHQTRQHPHLEFSEGYMIFDRIDLDHFEVWKSERISSRDELGGKAPERGRYLPHARLTSPRAIRAYRFQFPVLAAATRDGAVLLWNVPERRLFQTIDISASPHGDGNINYIDFDDEYVFLIGDGAKNVSVFSRATSRMAWNLGEHFEKGRAGPSTWRTTRGEAVFRDWTFSQAKWVPMPPGAWQSSSNRMNDAQVFMKPYQCWGAIHPDIKTNTLLVLGQGSLLLLRDYKSFFRDTSKPPAAFDELLFRDLVMGVDPRYVSVEFDLERDPLAWNSREQLWDVSPPSLMAVHDGKAFCVNLQPMFVDLERPAPVVASDPGDGGPAPADDAVERAAGRGPPCSLYLNYNSFVAPDHDVWVTALYESSCVQMDGTAAFCVDIDFDSRPHIQSFDFARTRRPRHASLASRNRNAGSAADSGNGSWDSDDIDGDHEDAEEAVV